METTNTDGATQMKKEIGEGLNGSGHTVWMVYSMRGNLCIHIEYFDTLAEANSWIRWA